MRVGVDIVDIDRIRSEIEKLGDRFIKKILTAKEIEIFNSKADKARFLAKRFAVKEAFSKALGVGLGFLGFHDITVLNDMNGKPLIYFSDRANDYIANLHNITIKNEYINLMGSIGYDVSISDEKRHCIAIVIFYKI